jgi:drug/metabolite transporter (DMT)-like permease
MTEPRDNIGGIIAVCAAMCCFLVSDVFTKLATTTLPVGETIALRGMLSATLFLIPVLMAGTLPLLRAKASKLWFLRVLAEMAVAVSFIGAITKLPLANVVSISQSSPIIMTAVGALWLGEKVGWQRWTATAAGFVGMLAIIKPGVGDFNGWSLLAVASVVFIIVRDLATRGMDRSIPTPLVTFTTAAGVAVAGLMLCPFEAVWRMPLAREWLYLVGGAIAVAGAYYFTIQAIRKADLSTIAPFRYIILPLSLLAGWLIWREAPDVHSLVGIAIIAAAGVTTFLREQRLMRTANG